ncbi:uncharacterized protein LOC116246039 [Nymphaea colorata]|nr:uncharacterized protein LOC116246039 [Nymphaea colorata]
MGNCLKIQSSSSWSTDDDDGGDKEFENGLTMMSRQPMRTGSAAGRRTEKMVEEGDGGGINGKKATMHGEVKIRMTKKQLVELVSVVGMEGLSIEEFLEKVTSLGIEENHLEQRRHWQPVLQSIPEEA